MKGRPLGGGDVYDQLRRQPLVLVASMKGRPLGGGDWYAGRLLVLAEAASMKGRPLGGGDTILPVSPATLVTPR